jgi:hypothetical protein
LIDGVIDRMMSRLPPLPRSWAYCALAASALFLLVFRARWSFSPHWSSDEGFLMAQMEAMLGQERATGAGDAEFENYFAPGAPIAWLPAGLIGHLLGWIFGGDQDEWVWACVGIWSFAFWAGSLFLMYRIVEAARIRLGWSLLKSDLGTALLLLLNIPVLYYALQRTMMSHTVEIFVALALFIALQARNNVATFLLAAFLSLTRFNDLPVFLMVFGSLMDQAKAENKPIHRIHELLPGKLRMPFAVLLVALILGIGWIAFYFGYGGYTLPRIFEEGLDWKNTRRFFVGSDWGILWLLPFWSAALGLGLFLFPSLSWLARGGLAWMVFQVLLCIAWTGNGNDFGQRYLIGTSIAVLVIVFEAVEKLPPMRTFLRALAIAGATWLTFLTLFYKSKSGMVPKPDRPDFAWVAIQHILDSEVYRTLFAVSPPGGLWYSWFDPKHPLFASKTLLGPGLYILTGASIVALGVCVGSVASRLRARKT